MPGSPGCQSNPSVLLTACRRDRTVSRWPQILRSYAERWKLNSPLPWRWWGLRALSSPIFPISCSCHLPSLTVPALTVPPHHQAGWQPSPPPPTCAACHLPPPPSEGQPGLLCAPFCVSFLTTASRLSAHPKIQVTNLCSHHPPDILYTAFFPAFSKAVLLTLTSQMPTFFLLSHIPFFLTISQFLFHR